MVGPTKAQVNKAGRILRSGLREEGVEEEKVRAALDVMLQFRAEHRLPLIKANMGLRSRVKTAGCELEVSQRLKRARTIVEKLAREPTLALGNMQDIGGCRAVLGSIPEIRRVQRRFDHKRPPLRTYDYIANPRSSGYRAVHLVIEYDGRQIEVQLRTQVMHEWAITVERLSGGLGVDLKSGQGPRPVLDLLEAISRAQALEERGEVVDSALVAEIRRLRAEAVG